MNSLPDYTALDERHQRIQQLVLTAVDFLVQEKVVHVFNVVLVQILEVNLRKAICDYQTASPSTPLDSLPPTPIAPPGFSASKLVTTPKTTPPPLTSTPPAPTQPSKQSSPLTINIKPVELIFLTPPTSPHPFLTLLKISYLKPPIQHLFNPRLIPSNI
nr:hypothetical protein [Tanacetum cinerariifolium]